MLRPPGPRQWGAHLGQVIWLKQFLEVEDKSAAINRTTGLDKQLKDMLKIWCRPKEKLAVGSHEYKEIIEADKELGVTCVFDDSVMEAMWGVKNLIRILVPQEQKALTMEERLPMSKGLEMILHRYGFDVKPEMVNDDIVETACFLYDIELVEKKHSRSLHMLDIDIKEISGLDSSEWRPMKLATAMKKICYPEEEFEIPPEMFSSVELLKIKEDAGKYRNRVNSYSVSEVYTELGRVYRDKEEKLRYMRSLVKAAHEDAMRLNQAS
ncbi:hypothetical protein HU200_028388 [Digitaria exilis]|uniref:Uncharacterized protein n=1 Tax=Digitaria exilis TaxID=1010633 RepID=A0A835EVG8_9POAL|nr:hypothetical protein HU200_028388 [Digitaria exilis]